MSPIHNYTPTLTLKHNKLVHLVHWLNNTRFWSVVSEPQEAVQNKYVLVITVAQNKQHERPFSWTPAPAVRTAPTYRSSSSSWSAAQLSEGELVMARNPQGHQRSATSTWMSLRSSAASLTSRGSKSWQPSISRLSFRTRHDTMHLKQGKTNNFTITQNPHTHGPPKLTETPPTMRQVTQNGLATMREGKGLEEEGLAINLISTRNIVGLAGEWEYHLPKKGPKNYYRLVWVD